MYEDGDPRTKEHKRQDRRDAAERENRREKMLRSGMTIDQIFSAEGITGEKEGGGMPWKNLYGPGGLYSEYGGAVLPGWIYDWKSGMKWPEATSDPNRKWEPITDHERRGRAEYDSFRQQNPMAKSYADYLNWQGLQQALRFGHATKDPGSGLFYNIGSGIPGQPQTYSEWWNPLGQKQRGMGYKGSNTFPMGSSSPLTMPSTIAQSTVRPQQQQPSAPKSPLTSPSPFVQGGPTGVPTGQSVSSNPTGVVKNVNTASPQGYAPQPQKNRYVPGIGGYGF